MMLVYLILIPFLAGLIAWPLARASDRLARWLCLWACMADIGIAAGIWWSSAKVGLAVGGPWLRAFSVDWIPAWGVRFALTMDGLSLLLVLLTALLGVVAVGSSFAGIKRRVGFFHFNLMWLLAALVGVFLATDLFLFYFFWEMMLVPLYLIIGIWGYENRVYATIKFFIFTQAASLLMLLAIIALAWLHYRDSGVWTFDYFELLGTPLSATAAMLLLLGFLAAFAVKLPAFGLHTWLPDAHTEAPTAGSVILASIVLKAGAFGLLRFALPLFPAACATVAPVAMIVAVIGILYGAITAFGQSDLKRLVAYTSVSHMGFVLLGAFAGNELALQGAVVVILAHGLSTGALFFLVGALSDRIHTRDLSRLGGLWAAAPRMGGMMMFFSLASLGLPGLANFVGEFLVLLGTFQTHPVIACVAAGGMVASVIYSLWMVQKSFQGPKLEDWRMPDLGVGECALGGLLIVATVWLGVAPGKVLELSVPAVGEIVRSPAVRRSPGPIGAPDSSPGRSAAQPWVGEAKESEPRQGRSYEAPPGAIVPLGREPSADGADECPVRGSVAVDGRSQGCASLRPGLTTNAPSGLEDRLTAGLQAQSRLTAGLRASASHEVGGQP